MADLKISGAPAVVTPAGTDEYATNQGGVSKKTTLAQILDEVDAGGGLLSGQYRFAISTVAADPGSGLFRYNNTDPALVTEIFIDDISSQGVNISNLLGLITTNDRLYFQSENDPSQFVVFNVTAPITDNTGWFTIAGTVEASGNLHTSNTRCLVVLQIGGTGAGAGDVFKSGIPLINQLAVWIDDETIKGDANWQVVGTALQGVLGSGPEMRNVAGVNIHPRKGDIDTGIASRGDNRLAMVAQGVDGIKLIGASTAVLQQHNTIVGLTAFAGGGQGSATQLNASYSVVDTVATTGDSVKFSTTLEVGVVYYVKNDGANALDLFPAGGDDLGLGIGVAISVPAGKSVAFIGTVTGSVSTQFIFEPGIAALIDDLSPQLGADLDTNGFNITNLDTTLLDLLIAAGSDGSGNGGTLTLRAGAAGGSATKGGSVVIEATNGAGGGAEGGDVSLICGNASGSGDDGGDFLGMGGNGTGAGGNGGNAVIEAGRSVGGGIGGIGETKGGVGGNGTNTGGIGRVIGGVGGDNGGSGGDAEVTGGPGVSAASDGDGGDAVISGGLGAGAGVDGDILFKHGGLTQFLLADSPNADFISDSFGGPAIRNRPTAGTIPVLCPNKGDLDTGVGNAQDDAVALISGGVLAVRYSENSGGIIEAPFASLSVTAFAAGGQGGFTLLNTNNVITTAASPGASVDLPPTFQINSLIHIKNDGANEVDVFPSLGDDLGAGTNVAVSLPVGESISFIGTVASSVWTRWFVDTKQVANDIVQARRTTNYILTTAFADITLDATDVETDAAVLEHDAVTDRLVAKVAGTYKIGWEIDAEATTVGDSNTEIEGRVRVNDGGVALPGSAAMTGIFEDASIDGDIVPQHLGQAFYVTLAINDFITLQLQKIEIAGSEAYEATRVLLTAERCL